MLYDVSPTFHQISGFRYNCSLRGTVNLTTVYNNESSLTCVVDQNQVMHCRCDLIMSIKRKPFFFIHCYYSKYILCTCTSVLCTPPQILSSSSAGLENITISIVWEIVSSGRQHPIDLRTPVSSQCILVSVVFILLLWMYVAVSCSGSVQLSLTSRRLLLMSGG